VCIIDRNQENDRKWAKMWEKARTTEKRGGIKRESENRENSEQTELNDEK
jgi:hypothetical protein